MRHNKHNTLGWRWGMLGQLVPCWPNINQPRLPKLSLPFAQTESNTEKYSEKKVDILPLKAMTYKRKIGGKNQSLTPSNVLTNQGQTNEKYQRYKRPCYKRPRYKRSRYKGHGIARNLILNLSVTHRLDSACNSAINSFQCMRQLNTFARDTIDRPTLLQINSAKFKFYSRNLTFKIVTSKW